MKVVRVYWKSHEDLKTGDKCIDVDCSDWSVSGGIRFLEFYGNEDAKGNNEAFLIIPFENVLYAVELDYEKNIT